MIPDQFANDPNAILAFVTGFSLGSMAAYGFVSATLMKARVDGLREIIRLKDQQIEALQKQQEELRRQINGQR